MKEKKIDYEQLYYDELYQNKELLRKCKDLEDENNIYKELLKNKPVKKIIAENLIKYVRRDKSES